MLEAAIEEREPGTHAPSEVVHKGQRFVGLESIWDEALQTDRFRSRRGSLPPESVGFAPLFHGMGPMTSHAGSMLATLNTLTASKKNKGRSESANALKRLPDYRLVGSEAIDLPGCHGREVPTEVGTLSGLADWVTEWVRPIAEAAQGPVTPIARSASAAVVLAARRLHPDLFDGVVLLSPMAPSDAEHSNGDLLGRVAESMCDLNQVAFDYMNRLAGESRWDEESDPFDGLPTLILTGEEDTQVSDRVRKLCAGFAKSLPHVEYTNLESAGHDVFNLRNRESGVAAFGLLYRFLSGLG